LKFLQLEVEASDSLDAELHADFDILLTDSLIRLGYHYLFGKVDPVTINTAWNMTRDINDRDPARVIPEIVEAHAVAEMIERLKPDHLFYRQLKQKLAEYRRIAGNGGWKSIPAGKPLKIGMVGPRVATLRERLAMTGDLTEASTTPEVFDEALKQAVQKFQIRHRLYVDGVAGKNTLAAMNVPVEKRIDQIRVNLERFRWVLHQIPETFVVADIAGFEVYYVHRNEDLWRARAQVGKPYRETPCFRSEIRYVVINPTWTIPPGILAKDILPAVKRDAKYLKKRNISVINRNGEVVDPKTIKWSRYNARNFPYILRQEPGPNNALGRVKIIFPNRYFVYIHDTPSKNLFKRSERAFSSGCIRVERPFELTRLLLNDSDRWSPEKLNQAVASKKTQTIFLPTRIPVLLLYLTAHVDNDGSMVFKKDIYKRDSAVLKALNGRFSFRKQPVAGRERL
jgi:murein L,D-transpeptidase YcbB/YkuD